MTRVVLPVRKRLRRTPSPSKPHFGDGNGFRRTPRRVAQSVGGSILVRNAVVFKADKKLVGADAARTRSLLGPINVVVHRPSIAQHRLLTHDYRRRVEPRRAGPPASGATQDYSPLRDKSGGATTKAVVRNLSALRQYTIVCVSFEPS